MMFCSVLIRAEVKLETERQLDNHPRHTKHIFRFTRYFSFKLAHLEMITFTD